MHKLSHSFIACSSVLGLLFGSVSAGRAQATLSLSPSAPTATPGSVETFTINLTGGTNLGGFDFNVAVDPTYLSFVGASPFVSGAGNMFDTPLTNALNTPGDLEIAYLQLGSALSNPGTMTLGTFQATVLGPLPAAGTAITFGPIGSAGTAANGSEVDDVNGSNVLTATSGAVLTPAAAVPETSSAASFGLLLLGLTSAAIGVRRAKRQS